MIQLEGIVWIRDIAGLDAYHEDWDRLAADASRFYPSYSEARIELEHQCFLVTIQIEDGRAVGIACFVNAPTDHSLTVGERRLISFPVRETKLFGGDLMGTFTEEVLRSCLQAAIREWPFDLLTLGEAHAASPLHRASADLGQGVVRSRNARKDPIRWFIRLPTAFDDYLSSLRGSTRKSITYAMRRFERELSFTHEVVSRPEQVEKFLRDGERISRSTYQWSVGERLLNDASTMKRYMRRAEQGRLRCHLLYVQDEPCAFSRGEISGHVFNYETPGFDPKLQRYSPGLILMMWTIRDLIDHTSCTLFDFGPGGDDYGYKSRFGTLAVPCVSLQFGNLRRPYSAVLLLAESVLSTAKNVASKLIGNGPFRQRLKTTIRVYGTTQSAG